MSSTQGEREPGRSLSEENAALLQRIRESEERYRSLVDATSQIVWTNSPEGEMVGEQPGWGAFTGQTPAQYTGYGWANAVHPDDRAPTVSLWHRAVETTSTFLCEHRVRRHDGVYRRFAIRAVPVREADGRVREWVGIHTDVTKQRDDEAQRLALVESERAARREAEEQKAMLDLIIEQSGDGIVMADETGMLRIFNPAAERQHGAEAQRAAAPHWAQTFHLLRMDGAPLPLEETPLYRALRGEGSKDARWKVRRPDGAVRTLVGTATPLRKHDGKLAGGVLVIRDDTERHREEEERERLVEALAKSNAELDSFAYVASHVLEAPLRRIANLSQRLEEDLGAALSGESRENMRLLRGRVHRLEALVDGILSYPRAGRGAGALEEIDVVDAMHGVVELLAPGPTAHIAVRGANVTLVVAKVLFQQVFLTLMANAITHARTEDPHVTIDVRDEGDAVHVSVQDDGPGIAPEVQARIWDVAQTLEARDDVEGTGIGLSVVKTIVEGRGGRVWVESSPGGVQGGGAGDGFAGATFHVTWPKVTRDEPRASPPDLGAAVGERAAQDPPDVAKP